MIYKVGDLVDIRSDKTTPWFDAEVIENNPDSYVVEFSNAIKMSQYLDKTKSGMDLTIEKVKIPKHLENLGLGWTVMRLKPKARG